MYVIMEELPVYDNRDAVIGTKLVQASPAVFETKELPEYLAGKWADECWNEINFFVADVADKRTSLQVPATVPFIDEDLPF